MERLRFFDDEHLPLNRGDLSPRLALVILGGPPAIVIVVWVSLIAVGVL